MNKKGYTKFWKEIGQTDPYFGVLTHPEYRSDILDERAKEKFFASGVTRIERVLKIFEKIWPNRQLKKGIALDFGCGTGRLTLALSKHFEAVTGVDVSAAMLEHANENQKEQSITNVTFKEVSDQAPFLEGKYDYIHSAMVFQHIPPENGLPILDHLLSHLNTGGGAFFNITYNNLASPKNKRKQYLNFTYPQIFKRLQKKADYAFPMFDYDLNQVFAVFQKHGVKRIHQLFGASGDHQFVNIYLIKGIIKNINKEAK